MANILRKIIENDKGEIKKLEKRGVCLNFLKREKKSQAVNFLRKR